jgi:hypothetical protein
MPILKINNNRQGYKLVGVTIPPLIVNYLLLYTLAHGTTKSSILKSLLEFWISQHQTKEPEEMLIKKVSDRFNKQWKSDSSHSSELTFNQFRQMVEKDLLKKGLKETIVRLILSNIKP